MSFIPPHILAPLTGVPLRALRDVDSELALQQLVTQVNWLLHIYDGSTASGVSSLVAEYRVILDILSEYYPEYLT